MREQLDRSQISRQGVRRQALFTDAATITVHARGKPHLLTTETSHGVLSVAGHPSWRNDFYLVVDRAACGQLIHLEGWPYT